MIQSEEKQSIEAIKKADIQKFEKQTEQMVQKHNDEIIKMEQQNAEKMNILHQKMRKHKMALEQMSAKYQDLQKNVTQTQMVKQAVSEDLSKLTQVENKSIQSLVKKSHHKKGKSSDQWQEQAQALGVVNAQLDMDNLTNADALDKNNFSDVQTEENEGEQEWDADDFNAF